MEMLPQTERARVRARDRKLRGPKVVVDNSGLKKVTMQVAERLRPYVELGFRHFDVGFPAPYDAETMERMITEVKPILQAG